MSSLNPENVSILEANINGAGLANSWILFSTDVPSTRDWALRVYTVPCPDRTSIDSPTSLFPPKIKY